jgi:hypothetical protein
MTWGSNDEENYRHNLIPNPYSPHDNKGWVDAAESAKINDEAIRKVRADALKRVETAGIFAPPKSAAQLVSKCLYCGHVGAHDGVMCHLVKAIEYYENGKVKRVELKTAADMPSAKITLTERDNIGIGDSQPIGPYVAPAILPTGPLPYWTTID